jgi:hypothetical protein
MAIIVDEMKHFAEVAIRVPIEDTGRVSIEDLSQAVISTARF